MTEMKPIIRREAHARMNKWILVCLLFVLTAVVVPMLVVIKVDMNRVLEKAVQANVQSPQSKANVTTSRVSNKLLSISPPCSPITWITGVEDDDTCDPSSNPDICCVDGESYPGYDCSPPADRTGKFSAIMTVNDFSDGGDGGAPSSCDESFHSSDELVVALSTGWYAGGSRCGWTINIGYGGQVVQATVVDECDSRSGCDDDHAFQKPCRVNVVDVSQGVFDALGADSNDELQVTWTF